MRAMPEADEMNPLAYLESLTSPWFQEEQGGIKEISHVDGATLYKVADEHYVVIMCMEHSHHQGHKYLAKVMPEDWVQFASFVNGIHEYGALHWGPA